MSGATDLTSLAALATFFLAAASPGPATLAVAATTMRCGRARGGAMALGLTIGLSIWGLAAALGFGALVVNSSNVLLALKLVGAAFLFYLAYAMGSDALKPTGEGADPAAAGPGSSMFLRGLVLNLSNPKAALAWIATLALGQSPTAQGDPMTLVGLCTIIGLAIYLAYAFLFSLPRVRSVYQMARRWIDGFAAVFFATAGIRLLTWKGAV